MKRTYKNPETVLSADIGEQSLELSVPRCLESLGISCLNEWDVLVFMYRHGTSLANADQIAPLIGYEGAMVARTLDWLEREKLIERSRASRGVHFYQIVVSTDAGRQRYLQQLIALSETRTGRLLLAKHLKAVRRRSLEKEGKWLCLKAI
jgi:DNA-binding MarR family transcriptional regulator